MARNPSRVDAKRGDHILQSRLYATDLHLAHLAVAALLITTRATADGERRTRNGASPLRNDIAS